MIITQASVYRVNKAVRARLLVLVDLVDDQEHHTHQEGQGADHQQGHLKETRIISTRHHRIYRVCLHERKRVGRLEQQIFFSFFLYITGQTAAQGCSIEIKNGVEER